MAKTDSAPYNKQGLWPATKETYSEFAEDDCMTQSAALAFYAGISLAPLLTLLAWISRFFGPQVQERIVNGFTEVLGQQAAEPIGDIMEQADTPGMNVAGIISLAILAFSATGVFAQLQAAMNHVWGIRQKPSEGAWGWIRKRILSFGMILGILFLLIASTVATTVLAVIAGVAQDMLPGSTWIWWVVNLLVSVGIFTLLFAVMFRYLPDARIEWRDVWFGAILTAILFTIGRELLSLYLSQSDYGSSYGAAVGSFLALLVWVYYSSLILFIGAEATQVYARRQGHPVRPDAHAERVIEHKEVVPA